jgi:signal transduction histidine kinase
MHGTRPEHTRTLPISIRQQAETVRPAGPAVEVVAGARPAAVEVAAYRIAGEALTNVVRHASASCCRIRLAEQAAELLVEVRDDGVGTPSDGQAGVLSLRERAAELGGRSEVTSPADGGTLVRAWLPLRRST